MPEAERSAPDGEYDEFSFLEGHAQWAGLPWTGRPPVVRRRTDTGAGAVSALHWGDGAPAMVLVHGAGQNAHSWDTFVMASGRPTLAVDLPGHGHSDWRDDRDYSPDTNAAALEDVVAALAPGAEVVVGMSLGGLTTLRLATRRPDLVPRAVIVDITPGVSRRAPDDDRPPAPTDLMRGPRSFASFEAMLDATAATMPHRSRESLVPGLRHNSRRQPDGTWGWRYDELHGPDRPPPDLLPLWDDVAALRAPAMLVRGARSRTVPDDAVSEFASRLPGVRVETVEDAGHAVQNDRPVELARLVADFVATTEALAGD